VALQPRFEVSGSQTITHSLQYSFEWVISPSQRPLRTQHTTNITDELLHLSGLRTRDCSSQAAAGVDCASIEIGIQVDHLSINGSKLSTAGIPKTSKQFRHVELHQDKKDRTFRANVFRAWNLNNYVACVQSAVKARDHYCSLWCNNMCLQLYLFILPVALTFLLWIVSNSSEQGFVLWR
jgi:hypothetical protein